MFCNYVQSNLVIGNGYLDSEQLGNIEPFAVTNLAVYFTNSEQSGFNEQFCNDQQVPRHRV